MNQIKAFIQAYHSCQSIRRTARMLQCSKNTVRAYLRRCQSSNKSFEQLLALDELELVQIVYPAQSKGDHDRQAIFDQLVAQWLNKLSQKGVTRRFIWENYRKEYTNGYGYSQFCERIKKEIECKDLTIAIEHPAGECMMVDFAGKRFPWIVELTGEVILSEILVAVLPHSQKTFMIALASQKIKDFVHGLNEALLFFGGLPKVILSDNLRSYVKKADRYDPDFTELCEQFAAHFQIDLQAARVGRPKDKASVENAIRTIYTRIYLPLQNKAYANLKQVNQVIEQQLKRHNAMPFQKRPGSRQSCFDQFEKQHLRPLPSTMFTYLKSTIAKVQKNYHVFIGEEKNYYSVPFQYVGKHIQVFYSEDFVDIQYQGLRIAGHTRFAKGAAFRYRTEPKHMPPQHQKWQERLGWDGQYFRKQAQKIGQATYWAIDQILLSRNFEPQAYNACLGVLRLHQKTEQGRMEKACLKCQKVGVVNYKMLKNILSKNLDQLDDQDTESLNPIPQHSNIRGNPFDTNSFNH